MEWHDAYLGIPFAEKGRDMRGFDCYGLLRFVYQRELNIEMPSYEWLYHDTIGGAKDISCKIIEQANNHWSKVDAEQVQPFDVVVMRMRGLPMHLGIVTRKGRMLHCIDGVGVSHESYIGLRWANRIVGFVRYANG